MRSYIVLCLVGLAAAAPQGYNYAAGAGAGAAPQAHHPQSQYGGSATAFLKDMQTAMAAESVNAEPNFAVSQQFTSTGFSAEPQALYQAPNQGRFLTSSSVSGTQQRAEPIVTKRFFLHSAPEEAEDELMQKTLTVGTPRKNYNVVFIKAPAKSAQRTSIKITPAAQEDKTVIYVLAKKQDASEIDAQVHEAATTTAKPEVYFIKYKTNEEAAHAQQTIQAQYDSLGGSTQVSNEGVARITSVIGSLNSNNQASASESFAATGASHEPMQYAPSMPGGQESVFMQQSLGGAQMQPNTGYLPPGRYY